MMRLLDTFHSHLTIVHKEDGARDTPDQGNEARHSTHVMFYELMMKRCKVMSFFRESTH